MKFCSECGGPLEDRVPPGEDRTRRVCTSCDHVHYQNPVVVVGCLVERGDEVLLCRRAIEPAHGRWTMPAGFLELGEGMAAGAMRETKEEALADVAVLAPHSFLDLLHIGQLHVTFRARMRSPGFAAGDESLECAFFHPDEIPWGELAFPAVHYALRLLLADRRDGRPHLHQGQLSWNGEGSRFDANNYVIDGHLRTPLG